MAELKLLPNARNLVAVLLTVIVGHTLIQRATAQDASAEQAKLRKMELETKSRTAYENIRPVIERISVGDSRSKVLEIVNWDEKKTSLITVRDSKGKAISGTIYLFYPGVLTPFNIDSYVIPSKRGERLNEIHFGYLDDLMLRPRKVIILEQGMVKTIVDISDPIEELRQPGRQQPQSGAETKKEDLRFFFRKEAYEKLFLTKRDQITTGMHWWEVFTLLKANYLVKPDLQSFTIMCAGLLNAERPPESTKGADGIRTVYPFGYMEGDVEYPQWEVIMLNRRVVEVRPYKDAKQNR
jgi:hypothetical protein